MKTQKSGGRIVMAMAMSVAAVLAWAGAAPAAVWVGPLTGDTAGWNTAINWSPATVPSDPLNIGATINSANPMDFSAVAASAEFLTIGGGATLGVVGGDLTYNGDGLIGTTAFGGGAGTAVVNQSAGTITQTGGGAGLILGHNRAGTWNLSNGTLNVRVNTWLGYGSGGAASHGVLNITGTGVLNATFPSGAQSVIIAGNLEGANTSSTGELRYTGGVGSSVTIKNDLRVGLENAGTLSVGGAGGTFNLGANLTFDRDDSTLNVVLNSANLTSIGGGFNAFNTLNSNTAGGTLDLINSTNDGAGAANLTVQLDTDLAPGTYQWRVINILPAGVYGTSGIYFRNITNTAIGFFEALADNATFTVFSTPTNTAYTFRVDYDGGPSGGGNDLVLSTTVVAVVPAPAALPAGLAMLGLIAARRRRSHR